MKYNESEITSKNTFSIKATSRSFAILSKGIYTCEISPPIRELATNAYDSHVAAGKTDVPFEVHLPSETEPYFSVRDYGVGMNVEEIQRIYTTYFESTKTQSNDYVGCLGLGSKSPFCYTDKFSVDSFQNGKRHYTECFLKEGIPSYTPIETENTTEDNGMLIKFSVKSNDIYTFNRKATEIYNRFLSRPKIVGGNDTFEYKEVKHSYSGDGWALIDGEYNSQSHAIMGNIAYPISSDKLKLNSYSSNEDEKKIFALIRCGVDVTFGIGELEVAASRESLHFDGDTINNVKSKLLLVFGELESLIGEKFLKCNSKWEAICLYYELYNGSMFDSSMRNIFNKFKFKYKTQEINSYVFNFRSLLNVRDYITYTRFHYGSPNQYRCDSVKKVRRKSADDISCNKNVMFVIDDLKTGGISRIRFFIENNKEKIVYVLDGRNDSALLQSLGYSRDNVVNTSTLEKPPVVKRDKSKTRIPSIKVLKEYISDYSVTQNWKKQSIDDVNTGTYFYIELDRNDMINSVSGKGISYHVMERIIEEFKLQKIISGDFVLYGLNKVNVKKYGKLKNWKSFIHFIYTSIFKYFSKLDLSTVLSDKEFYANHQMVISEMVKLSDLLKEDSMYFNKLYTDLVNFMEFKNVLSLHSKMIMILDNLSVTPYLVEQSFEPSLDLDLYTETVNNYPMLRFVNEKLNSYRGIDDNEATCAKEYVKLIENTL